MSHRSFLILFILLTMLLAACAPRQVEVTRVVEVTQEVPAEATRPMKTATVTSSQPEPSPGGGGTIIAPGPSPTKRALPTSNAGPGLFFTDLESGPNSGGQDDLGAFITLWGEGFGASRGSSTVTIGGQEVARYVIWGADNAIARNLDMIVVQPGPNVTSGDVVVTVNGKASNPLPFTVRSGQIYFVIPGAPNAADTNPGTYAEPFQTLYRPRQVMQAGDIVYIKGSTFSSADPMNPGWDAVLLLHPETDPNGTADRPIAYIGYPGDRPLINAPEPLRRGIYMDPGMMYYVFANLAFTQGLTPYEGMLQMGGNGHRAIGNYFYDALSSTGMGIAGNSAHYQVFGNLLSNNGQDNWEDGVGFYIQGFGTNQDIDFGWNQIQDQRGRRAIQLFGHEDGDRMDNVRIHDNLILSSLQLRNNILLGGSDGGTEVLGTIYVYNNIIVGSDWEGLRVNDPQGTVIIQNNVLYDNGSLGPDSHAQIYIERAGAGRVTVQNNVLYAESGQTYYEFGPGADPSALNASHDLMYNAGACPAWDAGCVNADPLFVDATANDFRLQAGSPAIDAGINTSLSRDYAGVSRPQGGAYDIGAHEFSAPGAAMTLPTAPPVRVAPTQLPQPTLPSSASPQPQLGAFHWVALGDSLTEGDGKSDVERRYTNLILARIKTVRPQADLHNVGKSGWTLEQMNAEQLPVALAENPALVTIWIGANDVIYFNPDEDLNASATAFEQRLDAAVSQLVAHTRARVILANLHDISLIPAARGWSEAERAARHEMTIAVNQAIANVVQRHADRVSLVDIFNLAALREASCYADDYHPSDDCEPRIADAWWVVIQAALR